MFNMSLSYNLRLSLVVCMVLTSLLASSLANPRRHYDCNPAEEYACPSDHNCIPRDWVCDRYEDCDDGQDENQNCPARPACDNHEFTCANGNCIPDNWVCDEDDDCQDGSDENVCTGGEQHRRRVRPHSHQVTAEKKRRR